MEQKGKTGLTLDPRSGLLILVFANIIAFTQDCIAVEFGWIGVLSLLIIICGRVRSGIKWVIAFAALYLFQWYVLPVSPKIIATSFSIFCNYARRMFPCLMVGSLMIHTISLRKFIVGLRKLHIPQRLIIPISVTIRYLDKCSRAAYWCFGLCIFSGGYFIYSSGVYFMKGEAMIQIKDVSFAYANGLETLHNINLSAKKGECILLCGESGCGKTTVTKLVNGLIPHFAEECDLKGNVQAAGLSVADTELYELAKHIGSVFQNPKSQLFNLDTDSEIAFGLENEGADPE